MLEESEHKLIVGSVSREIHLVTSMEPFELSFSKERFKDITHFLFFFPIILRSILEIDYDNKCI